MKLSQQQTRALAFMFAEKENAKIDSINQDKLKKLKQEADKKAIEMMKIIDKLPNDVIEMIGNCYGKPTKSKVAEKFMKNRDMKKRVSWEEFEGKILIASIDSETIDELKKKLKID